MNDSALNQLDLLDRLYSRNETRFGYLLEPDSNASFLGIDIFAFFPICIFHQMVRIMVKREKRKQAQEIVADLLSCYTIIVPLTFTLISSYLNILTRYSHPPWIISGHWFCVSFEIFCHCSFIYIGGFSVAVAVSKYIFIVHSSWAIQFGEARIRKICLISHLVLPVVVALLNSFSNGRIDQLFWVDHCWSFRGWRFNHANATNVEKITSFCCTNRQYDITDSFGDGLRHAITTGLRVLCGSLKITYLVFLSNIVELFLYYRIFNYLNRYPNVF